MEQKREMIESNDNIVRQFESLMFFFIIWRW